MERTIVIIDYGMGNLRSVSNAFRAIGQNVEVATSPSRLFDSAAIVLPGVGSFADAMKSLESRGWIEALEKEVIQKGKPFLGLCLGLQLLATSSTEHGFHAGLNWIPGRVERIQSADPGIRVPHVGWNDVHFLKQDSLYQGLGVDQAFYFVHSFVFHPQDMGVVTGMFAYGGDFIASVEKDNIFATQFHPEKSQKIGLAVLKNFSRKVVDF